MTILIAEAHDVVRGVLREWLESTLPQGRVIEAANGEQAVILAQTELPQMVVMDVSLPQMSSLEATRHIKAITPETEVVITTTYEDEVYRAAAATAGASACVTKWKMRTQLLPVLERLLSTRDEWGTER